MAPAAPAAQVQSLERKLTTNVADPNPLLPLLVLARNGSPEVVHKAVWALYRVFGKLIAEGRVGGITGVAAGSSSESLVSQEENGTAGSREVKGWVRDRLLEYVEILGGLVRDVEPSLRTSGIQLLFALLPALTESSGAPVHIPYFRLILRSLITPGDSLRGAKPAAESSKKINRESVRWDTVAANQEGEAGSLPFDSACYVVDEYWAKYDDLRLFFFREAAQYLTSDSDPLEHPANLLMQLVPLVNLPKIQDDLNAFFLPNLAEKPSKADQKAAKRAKTGKGKKGKKDVDQLPDWMDTYESEGSEEEGDAVRGKRARTTALNIHMAVHTLQAHTAAYTAAWEGVLSYLPLDASWTRRILAGLHGENGILAYMAPARRVRVADWLGTTVDQGGAHAMLAMNGLFVLMTQYHLDYPNFYQRLYGLLDANVLHARYRARFFRLLDTFLRSALLPAALIASFIKRLARLALTAPPAGAILVIPFVYNLFKRHPGTMVMLQRLPDDGEDVDPFDNTEPQPNATKAIDSSVWELNALKDHYLASVGTLAKVFSEQFTKPEFNIEDFLDHGYATLFETEANRKIKNAPALNMQLELGTPVQLFPKAGAEVDSTQDPVAALWAF